MIQSFKTTFDDPPQSCSPLLRELAEMLDHCSTEHRWCSSCSHRAECYKLWLIAERIEERTPLSIRDFIYYSEAFRQLAAEETAHQAGCQGKNHTGYTPYKTKTEYAY